MVANRTKVPPLADKEFLSGKRVFAAFNRIVSSCLKKEFRQDALGFLEEFMNSELPTIAARSIQDWTGIELFLPYNHHWWDDHAPLHLLGLLLDGLQERGCIKGSEIEARRAEYQSFVQEQRQLERSSTRSRPNVGDVLSFCFLQAGFRACQHLCEVCIVYNMVKPCDLLSRKKIVLFFSGVPANSSHCTRDNNFPGKVHHESGAFDDLRR